jgi:hypothetical protein
MWLTGDVGPSPRPFPTPRALSHGTRRRLCGGGGVSSTRSLPFQNYPVSFTLTISTMQKMTPARRATTGEIPRIALYKGTHAMGILATPLGPWALVGRLATLLVAAAGYKAQGHVVHAFTAVKCWARLACARRCSQRRRRPTAGVGAPSDLKLAPWRLCALRGEGLNTCNTLSLSPPRSGAPVAAGPGPRRRALLRRRPRAGGGVAAQVPRCHR